MADISKIRLGGADYDIKDAVARQMITGGLSFNIVWTSTDYSSSTTPTSEKLAGIPEGVVVQYDSGAKTATGTMAPEDSSSVPRPGFYLVYRRLDSTTSRFDEYVVVTTAGGGHLWEKIGNTELDLKGLVTNVTLSKENTNVYWSGNTFTNSSSSVSAESGTGSTASVMTGITTLTKSLTPTDVVTSAVGSVSLTGTTTFNTDAVKATYTSNTETLELSSASTGTVDVSTTSSIDKTSVLTTVEETSSAFTVLSSVTPTTDTVVKTLPTLTAAAQTITIGGTSQTVLRSQDTDVVVTKHS